MVWIVYSLIDYNYIHKSNINLKHIEVFFMYNSQNYLKYAIGQKRTTTAICSKYCELRCHFVTVLADDHVRIKNYKKEMSVFHDEIEIEDFEYDDDEEIYYYPCPCGDRFQITKVKISNINYFRLFHMYFLHFQEELLAGEEVATCPSCSLIIKVIYDLVS